MELGKEMRNNMDFSFGAIEKILNATKKSNPNMHSMLLASLIKDSMSNSSPGNFFMTQDGSEIGSGPENMLGKLVALQQSGTMGGLKEEDLAAILLYGDKQGMM